MAVPLNILQNVQTYQPAELAFLLNSFVALSVANKKFKNFENETAQLGDTVTFDLAPRATTAPGLVITLQKAEQRKQVLSCTQAINSAYAFDAKQYIFNVSDYMERFGMARIQEIGSKIENDILQNVTGTVRVQDPQNPLNGTLVNPASGPYRFYGNGITPINSFPQLAQALADFRSYGASDFNVTGILPMEYVPAIVATGLQQFTMDRNNDLAASWELGQFSRCTWTESNLLPLHIAGTAGDTGATLTLVSTNDPTGNNITQITVSSTLGSDVNAMKTGDLLQFDDTTLRYLTFIGHLPTSQPVQIKSISDSPSVAGTIVIDIFPALQSTPGANQNINKPLVAGMTLTVTPSHRAGVIMSGNPLYVAMPRMPDEDPFSTSSHTDPGSGISIRNYWGAQFGQDTRAYVYDALWGSTLVAENSMRLIFPITP